jgi:hypothetical protein
VRFFSALAVLVALAYLAPLQYDARDLWRVRESTAAADRERARRLEPLRAAHAKREAEVRAAAAAEADEVPGVGKPLSASLGAFADLAANSRLTFATLAAKPPVNAPGFTVNPVKVAVTGAPAALRRYVEALPQLEVPVRVRDAALRQTGPTSARLEMELEVLVERS